MRLNKFIAQRTQYSRRKADELIEQGRVTVNGDVCKEMGVQVDPENDVVTVNRKKLISKTTFTYIMFHKPEGYTTTKADPHAAHTIYDLLPKHFHGLHPVGRLDRNTEGLLILTDDGDFTYALTHPSNDCSKTYFVKLKAIPNLKKIAEIEKGIRIQEENETYLTRPCKVHHQPGTKTLQITLHEGRKRQIRKMFEQIGAPVVYLKRLKMGPYKLGELPRGQWKDITKLDLNPTYV